MSSNFLKRLASRVTVLPRKPDFPRFAILLGLFLFLLIYWGPEWHVEHLGISRGSENFAELANKYRSTYAQILGGVLFLSGLYFAWQRLEVARESQDIDRQNQLTNQEGQITERFTRAVDQLGKESLVIRLGGIYALERIARDSEKDHWTVMEVLTAYVRERSPWREPPPETKEDETKQKLPPLPTDIQAALTVIGRRKWIKNEKHQLDLHGTDLRNAKLFGAHLERANLTTAHLEWANLMYAQLGLADLFKANLKMANLHNIYLKGAVLISSHLEGAILSIAHLEEADLRFSFLEEANLEGANLMGANLKGANLERANLDDAHLEGADLSDAVGLTPEQIASAITDGKTKFPDDYLWEPE